MFQFEKLEVYHRSKKFAVWTRALLKNLILDKPTESQLRRASTSILLNISEGTSRFTNPDRKRYFSMARGSVFECYSILDLLIASKEIDEVSALKGQQELIVISKMLFALMKKWS